MVFVIGIGWVIFWTGWLVAGFTAKSSRGRWSRFRALRIALIVVAAYFIRLNWHGRGAPAVSGPVLAGVGLALWAAGIGLAVWARLYIGRNWGMPMTRREQPDLVTSGPYRYIRHPIYTGIITALLGTALATTPLGLIAVAVVTAFFVFSAIREERFLAGEFPGSYPAYKARTKMLIPFIL
ncbi:MAG TPA: isoprenylcysteine carboxylmethyltransferase family protein [Trebonia sp.]